VAVGGRRVPRVDDHRLLLRAVRGEGGEHRLRRRGVARGPLDEGNELGRELAERPVVEDIRLDPDASVGLADVEEVVRDARHSTQVSETADGAVEEALSQRRRGASTGGPRADVEVPV